MTTFSELETRPPGAEAPLRAHTPDNTPPSSSAGNRWLARARAALLPRSREQSDFVKACREWDYTNECREHEEATASCEICDQPNLRYLFQIGNPHTRVVPCG